uniref:Uncharacterized protein n=1 Tax=Candidatus Kentrum sp. FW TaxID=2126338 RepID=A0A450TUF6_9GAMM|nr:MAG: hypothetical protein BECKFW1821C_GA0114237_103410 [Candidatus Kentron sp. FW]
MRTWCQVNLPGHREPIRVAKKTLEIRKSYASLATAFSISANKWVA